MFHKLIHADQLLADKALCAPEVLIRLLLHFSGRWEPNLVTVLRIDLLQPPAAPAFDFFRHFACSSGFTSLPRNVPSSHEQLCFATHSTVPCALLRFIREWSRAQFGKFRLFKWGCEQLFIGFIFNSTLVKITDRQPAPMHETEGRSQWTRLLGSVLFRDL